MKFPGLSLVIALSVCASAIAGQGVVLQSSQPCVTCQPQAQATVSECVTCVPMTVTEYVPQTKQIMVPQVTQTLHLDVPLTQTVTTKCGGTPAIGSSLTASPVGPRRCLLSRFQANRTERLAVRLAKRVAPTVTSASVPSSVPVTTQQGACGCSPCDCQSPVAPPAPSASEEPAVSYVPCDDCQSTDRYISTEPVTYAAPVKNEYQSSYQSWAQREANQLASGGTRYYKRVGGHPNGSPPGCFVGTGWASGGRMPGTCVPGRFSGRRLVADATARGQGDTVFRCRVWR